MKKPRTLDRMFRDSLIDDCIAGDIIELPVWKIIGFGDLSRMQTLVLIKSWVKQINRMYRGSMRCNANTLKIDPTFLSFMATHRSMGTSEMDSREAWAALRSMVDD